MSGDASAPVRGLIESGRGSMSAAFALGFRLVTVDEEIRQYSGVNCVW